MNHTITQSVADIFSRPADNNYDSIEELLNVAHEEMNKSRILKVQGSDIRFSATSEGFNLDIDGSSPMKGTSLPLTNFSLTQVAKMAKIPTMMLERLHQKGYDDLVVNNLDSLFPNKRSETKFILVRDHYDDVGGIDSVVRAINGSKYARLWDYDMFSEVEDLLIADKGFTPALPQTDNNNYNTLMQNLNTGLFRGDQCSFGFFFVDQDLDGYEDSKQLGGLKPGIVVWNSEVGARSFGFHTFYYHEASGSIIIWTPANHKYRRYVHTGSNIQQALKDFIRILEDTANNFQTHYTDSLKIFNLAASTLFVHNNDFNAAVEKLNKNFRMSASTAKTAMLCARGTNASYGLPLSVWNVALGIAWEAGQTGRAESLVDSTLVATKVMMAILKI